jgi:hypothetical protein
MRSLLFHAISSENKRDWENFLRESSVMWLPKGGEQLASNVWLFPIERDEQFDLEFERICRRNAISYRCLLINHSAEWQYSP